MLCLLSNRLNIYTKENKGNTGQMKMSKSFLMTEVTEMNETRQVEVAVSREVSLSTQKTVTTVDSRHKGCFAVTRQTRE